MILNSLFSFKMYWKQMQPPSLLRNCSVKICALGLFDNLPGVLASLDWSYFPPPFEQCLDRRQMLSQVMPSCSQPPDTSPSHKRAMPVHQGLFSYAESVQWERSQKRERTRAEHFCGYGQQNIQYYEQSQGRRWYVNPLPAKPRAESNVTNLLHRLFLHLGRVSV